MYLAPDVCDLVYSYWGESVKHHIPNIKICLKNREIYLKRRFQKVKLQSKYRYAPKSDKRCQCTINNTIFKNLLKSNKGIILNKNKYKHLYKPILKEFKKTKKDGVKLTSDSIKKIGKYSVKKSSTKKRKRKGGYNNTKKRYKK